MWGHTPPGTPALHAPLYSANSNSLHRLFPPKVTTLPSEVKVIGPSGLSMI